MAERYEGLCAAYPDFSVTGGEPDAIQLSAGLRAIETSNAHALASTFEPADQPTWQRFRARLSGQWRALPAVLLGVHAEQTPRDARGEHAPLALPGRVFWPFLLVAHPGVELEPSLQWIENLGPRPKAVRDPSTGLFRIAARAEGDLALLPLRRAGTCGRAAACSRARSRLSVVVWFPCVASERSQQERWLTFAHPRALLERPARALNAGEATAT